MKKYIYLLMMALITVSCNETDELQNSSTDTPRMLNAKITKAESRAVWDTQPLSWDNLDQFESRTYAKPEGDDQAFYRQYWSVDDRISYFNSTFNSIYKSTKKNESKDEYITYFVQVSTGEGEPLDTILNYGVYPYKEDTKIATDGTVTFTFPEEQLYCIDSYANGHNFMIGRHQSEDQVLEFLNFCSYLKFQLTSDINKDVDKIVLKANNQKDFMTGVGTIAFNAEGYPKVTMDHERSFNHLVLNCRKEITKLKSDSITNFWFVLPGDFTFTKGFTITVSFTDGTYFKKNTNANLKPIKIERNHILPITELTLPQDSLKTSVIRYKYESQSTIKDSIKFVFGSFLDEDNNNLTPTTSFDKTTGIYEVTFNGHLYSIETNTFNSKKEIKGALDIDWISINNSSAILLNKRAFYSCTADSIAINNGIMSIGTEVFASSKTKYLLVNGDIHTIKEKAFTLGNNLKKIVIDGEVEHIDYQGFTLSNAETVIVLKRVTNIGHQAFMSCTNLTTIELPKVEHIEEEAFYNCYNLLRIDLCAVHKIGNGAFAGCESMEEVHISRDCISIGYDAFIDILPEATIYIYATEPPALISPEDGSDLTIFPTDAFVHIPVGSKNKYCESNDYWNSLGDYLVDDIKPEDIENHYGH